MPEAVSAVAEPRGVAGAAALGEFGEEVLGSCEADADDAWPHVGGGHAFDEAVGDSEAVRPARVGDPLEADHR